MAEKETKKKKPLAQIPKGVWISAGFLIFIVSVVFGLFIHCDYFGITSAENVRDVFLVLVAAIAAPFVIWRMIITNEQKETEKQKKEIDENKFYMDIYFRSLEHLAKEDEVIKLGAAYALAKIAEEDKNHYKHIMELLCSYIRKNTQDNSDNKNEVDIVIQSILDILSRRRTEWEEDDFRLNLSRANFQNSDLRGRNFKRFNLQWASLEGADFSFARLERADFSFARLKEACLIEADIRGANFESANLFSAKLFGATLIDAKLSFAHLEKTNLSFAHFEKASLLHTHLEGADLYKASLKEAELISAHLQGAHLQRADLQRANLKEANLQKANLKDAHLEDANLEEADLKEANLTGAKMETAKNLTLEQIESAFGDFATTLPPNLKCPEHWPKRKLTHQAAYDEWQKWREDPHNY